MVVPHAMVLITVLILPSAVTCVQSALRRVCWARNTFRPILKWMRLNARSTWILGRGAARSIPAGGLYRRTRGSQTSWRNADIVSLTKRQVSPGVDGCVVTCVQWPTVADCVLLFARRCGWGLPECCLDGGPRVRMPVVLPKQMSCMSLVFMLSLHG